jgi:AcrR family transcriptional regulator
MARTKSNPNRADLIMEAAMELFSRYGYERTSIEDISKHLGIGKGSIYLEFRTKEDILLQIIERFATSIQSMMDEEVENCEGSPLATLKNIFVTSALAVYDRVSRDIHTPEGLLHTSMTLKARFRPFFVRKRERITKLLRMAAKAGEISEDIANEDTAVTLLMAVSSIYPPYYNNYTESEQRITREELESRAEQITTIVVEGLKSQR